MDKNTVLVILTFIAGICTMLYGLIRCIKVYRLIDRLKNESDEDNLFRESNYTFVYIMVGFLFVTLSICIAKYF